jgi:hypothetical protein
MLQIFITIKNKSTLVEFEPMNLGSNGKHAAGKCKTIRKWQRNPALINKDQHQEQNELLAEYSRKVHIVGIL